VPPVELRALLRRALDVMCAAGPPEPAPALPELAPTDSAPPDPPDAGSPAAPELADLPAWRMVERSRRPNRPGVAALLTPAGSQSTPLAGPGPGLVLARARFGDAPCVLGGQNRRGPAPGPAGLRAARRGLRLAAQLRLPLVSVVDTGGAELSPAAEEGGLAAE